MFLLSPTPPGEKPRSPDPAHRAKPNLSSSGSPFTLLSPPLGGRREGELGGEEALTTDAYQETAAPDALDSGAPAIPLPKVSLGGL